MQQTNRTTFLTRTSASLTNINSDHLPLFDVTDGAGAVGRMPVLIADDDDGLEAEGGKVISLERSLAALDVEEKSDVSSEDEVEHARKETVAADVLEEECVSLERLEAVPDDLLQTKSLVFFSMQSVLGVLLGSVGEIVEDARRGETIDPSKFELIAEILFHIASEKVLYKETLEALGFHYNGVRMDMAQHIFRVICSRYMEGYLSPKEHRALSTQVREGDVKFVSHLVLPDRPLTEREVSYWKACGVIQASCVSGLYTVAILGRFASYLELDIESLSLRELYALHDDINNSKDALRLMRELKSCVGGRSAYLRWMSFVMRVNHAVIDDCFIKLDKIISYRNNRLLHALTHEEHEALNEALLRAASYHFSYCSGFDTEEARTLLEKTNQLIDRLNLFHFFEGYLVHVSNRGLLNLLFCLFEHAPKQIKGKKGKNKEIDRALSEKRNAVYNILESRSVGYESCANEFDDLIAALEASPNVHKNLGEWGQLIITYRTLLRMHSQCDVLSIKNLFKRFCGSTELYEKQKEGLKQIDGALKRAYQVATHAYTRMSQLLLSCQKTFCASSVGDQKEHLYRLHEFGNQLGFSTITIDEPLLMRLIVDFKATSTGSLRGDIYVWERIAHLYHAIIAAPLSLEDGSDVIDARIERRHEFRKLIQKLFNEHLEAYRSTFDPAEFLPDLSDLTFLLHLGRSVGFSVPFVDAARLRGMLSRFEASDSLRADLFEWREIFVTFFDIARSLPSGDPILIELREKIDALFNRSLESYEKTFDARDFLDDLDTIRLVDELGKQIGLNTRFIAAGFEKLAVENRNKEKEGQEKEKEK